jgi:hypothetical protein
MRHEAKKKRKLNLEQWKLLESITFVPASVRIGEPQCNTAVFKK